MGMSDPIVAEIAKGVFCINEFGISSIFLIVGSERALLVDTGLGVFDLPALVRSLTDLPYDVALTHGHEDHAGGIGWFDRVYLGEADFGAARENASFRMRSDYRSVMLSACDSVWEIGELAVPERVPEFLPIREGDAFDLGGRRVLVYETPGHTEGGVSFLVEDARILLSGDACNDNTLLFAEDGKAALQRLLSAAEKIESLAPLYDRNYNGHIGFGDRISFLPLQKGLIGDMIGLVRSVLSGETRWEAGVGFLGRTTAIAKCGSCQVCFNPKGL